MVVFLSGQFLAVDLSSQERQLKPEPGMSVAQWMVLYICEALRFHLQNQSKEKLGANAFIALKDFFLPTFLPSKISVAQQCLAVESIYPHLLVRPRMLFQRLEEARLCKQIAC